MLEEELEEFKVQCIFFEVELNKLNVKCEVIEKVVMVY